MDLICLQSCYWHLLSHVTTMLSDDVLYSNARCFHLQQQLLQSHIAHLSLSAGGVVYPLRRALPYDACCLCSMPVHSSHSYLIYHLSQCLSPAYG